MSPTLSPYPLSIHPGPEVRVRSNDSVDITVHNQLPEDVTVHWHGLHMRDQVWMDGVPSVTQCAIRSGESFRYTFRVDQEEGTFWWHSHAREQLADGMYGAFIVLPSLNNTARDNKNNKGHVNNDIVDDENNRNVNDGENSIVRDFVVFLQDWMHESTAAITAHFNTRPGEYPGYQPDYPWPANSVLINFKGNYDCKFITEEECQDIRNFGWDWRERNPNRTKNKPGKGSKGQCQPDRSPYMGSCEATTETPSGTFTCPLGKEIRMRLIHSGIGAPLHFWIDRHELTIIAKDGSGVQPTGPYVTVVLFPGQRIDVLVSCSRDPQFMYYIYARVGLVTSIRLLRIDGLSPI